MENDAYSNWFFFCFHCQHAWKLIECVVKLFHCAKNACKSLKIKIIVISRCVSKYSIWELMNLYILCDYSCAFWVLWILGGVFIIENPARRGHFKYFKFFIQYFKSKKLNIFSWMANVFTSFWNSKNLCEIKKTIYVYAPKYSNEKSLWS